MLTRSKGTKIGLLLDGVDTRGVYVEDVLAGPIYVWNQSHSPEMQVRPRDVIVSVNEICGDIVMIASELRSSLRWVLKIHRPVQLETVQTSRRTALGMDIKHSANGKSLLISTVPRDPECSWVGKHSMVVKAKDRIIEINGYRGKASELLDAIVGAESLSLVILHYP